MARKSAKTSEDLICEAALAGFATRGVDATSIRDVAAEAGVSAGIVQYHYATKQDLREAVHEYVLSLAAELFADPPKGEAPEEVQRELGDRVTRLAREHPNALLYVARLAADEDPLALEVFDAFLAIADRQWSYLAEQGLLRPDVDRHWAALHAIVNVLGSVLLQGAISRHLPAPWQSSEQLERWNQASSALFQHGLYRGD